MTYNSVSEFRLNAFPSGSFADNTDTEIATQLSASFDEVNGYLAVRNTLPLVEPVPSVIKNAELTITSWRMHIFNGIRPASVDDALLQRYYEVVGDPTNPNSGLLYRIATGKFVFANNIDSTARNEAKPIVVATSTSTGRSPGNAFGVKR